MLINAENLHVILSIFARYFINISFYTELCIDFNLFIPAEYKLIRGLVEIVNIIHLFTIQIKQRKIDLWRIDQLQKSEDVGC